MPAMDKKTDKPKVVSEKGDKPIQKAADAPKKIEVTLPSFSLELGPDFTMKLVLMGLLALIFIFSLVIFTKTNFATIDSVDFARLQYNLPKLWGLWFIVFALVFSLAIALAVLHGYKASKIQAGFPLVLLFLIAAVAGVIFPNFSLAFYAFALCVGIASIDASFHNELTLQSIWGITSKALFVLLILTLLFSYAKFSSNKEVYFNHMLGSVSSAVPDLVSSSAGSLGQQTINLCADAVESVQVSREMVASAISKDDFTRAISNSNNALYNALPDSTKQSIIDSTYDSAINQTLNLTKSIKTTLATQMRSINATKEASKVDIASKLTPDEIKKVMAKIPAFKQVQDAFPIIAAMTIMSLMTIVNFFVHILATIFAWLLSKAI